MKHMRKLASLLLALVMVFALATTAFAAVSNVITIDESGTKHVYEVYQLLTGTYDSETKELTNINWGSNVSSDKNAAEEFADVTADTTISVSTSAKTVTIGEKTYQLTGDVYGTITYVDGEYTLTGVDDGYYVILDVSGSIAGEDDAYSAGVVRVAGGSVTVTPKSATPSVDKQVHDETTDAEANAVDGWGETADHAIYEVYQYKLIANLPNDADLDDYDHYYLQFVDNISTGVSCLGNFKVYVNDTQITDFTVSDNAQNTSQDYPLDGAAEFTVTIQDVKTHITDLKGATVTVVYDAWLNPACAVGNVDTNRNKVSLKYSNNPEWNGTGTPETGETGPDYVFTFTYDVKNTKIDGTTNQNLAGAQFKLYSSYDETTKTGSNEISLIYDKGKKAYRPIKSGETAAAYLESAEGTGVFNIVGLDAGTYYLVEEKAPTGYNVLEEPIIIVIDATHSETSATSVSVTFTEKTSNVNNTIKNYNGTTLPETGGIGTTIFYVVGSVLVIGAAVLLVTKKRMSAEG